MKPSARRRRTATWTSVRSTLLRKIERRLSGAGGERVAVFRYDGKISAVSNVCRHQNGPLGEGRIVDGCITCPWHGYQYKPETGAAPPPFTERVSTYRVRVRNGRVEIDPQANQPGTFVEPARLEAFATRDYDA